MPTSRSHSQSTLSASEAENRLRRVLLHERRLNYSNRSVIGGLDGLFSSFTGLLPWVGNLAPKANTRYASLGPGERQIWVERALEKLTVTESRVKPEAPPAGSKPRAAGGNERKRPVDPATASTRRQPAGKNRQSRPTTAPKSLDRPLSELGIVARTTAEKLAKAGVTTLQDLLWFFPRRHIDYSKPTRIGVLELNQEATVIGHVASSQKLSIGRRGAARVLISDGSGLLSVTFFGQPYLADRLQPGTDIALSGRVGEYRGRAQMENPEYEVIERRAGQLTHAGNLLPVYPAPDGLPQRTLRNAARKALEIGSPLLQEMLPETILSSRGMPGIRDAISRMHFPASLVDAETARRRLAFDELLLNQLLMLQRRSAWRSAPGATVIENGSTVADRFLAGLEFDLTADQQANLRQILDDLASGIPMTRLLQGEVGSGKTVVALAAILACVANGQQGVFLAPTEVLAEQHFLSTSNQLGAVSNPLLPPSVAATDGIGLAAGPVHIGLLTGSMGQAQKSRMRELIAAGEIDIVIGTHALLQEAVEIPRMALAVIDEQHRFGVEQRAVLSKREPRPHMLAMSATPIPRTLALTVYGDLDVSLLRQMPAGRAPISTTWVRDDSTREQAYRHVRSEVEAGRQGFIVFPLIDESDAVAARAAVPEFDRLSSGPLAGLRLALLHGRMALAEKQAAMDRFRNRDADVLVATPVIEVGVDVPNATVMLIESADRFGLSQLHQLRGRVGRGSNPGICYLLADSPSDDAVARLQAVEATSDGFELAEKDLQMRGPGDYTGSRQSGWSQMRVATPADLDLIEVCREEAGRLLRADPGLEQAPHRRLALELEVFSRDRPAEIS